MIRKNVEEAIKFCETLAQDPEFKKRCEKWRTMVAGMMGRAGR